MPLVKNDQSDAVLLAAVRAGQSVALHTFYSRYCAGAYTLALHMLGNEGEAEECVQEVFLVLWRDPPGEEALPCGQWVRQAVHEGARQRLRSRVSAHPLVSLPSVGAAPDPPSAIPNNLLVLTPLQRMLLDMAYFSVCPPAELAARLHLPLPLIQEQLRAGLHTLYATGEASSPTSTLLAC